MLKQDQIEEQAAGVRVTPEELAAAISRIEARKDAEQRQVDGTIPIGEAVQQLGLEATPEEVLAEVRAGRQRQTMTRKRLPPIAGRLVLALGLSGIMLGLALGGNGLSQMHSHVSAGQSSVSNDTDLRHISLDPNLRVTDTTGKIFMISEVGDNQPVQCDFDTGNSRFKSLGDGRLFHWTLIKHNGKVYVRGRIVRMSPKVMQTDGALVGVDQTAPPYVVPVTLPMDGFEVHSSGNEQEQFYALNIHLDEHAYEKWQP